MIINYCIISDVNGTPVTEQVTMATDSNGNPVTEPVSPVTITNSQGNIVTDNNGNAVTTQLPFTGSLTENQCPYIGMVDWELICNMFSQYKRVI